jgi:DNA-binding NarL/FixJ family response regulator
MKGDLSARPVACHQRMTNASTVTTHSDSYPLSVVIIDDHPIVRAGMIAILDAATGVRVVAEGADAADAMRLTLLNQPDVLALDVNLPDANGLQVTRRLRAQGVTTPILILTAYDEPHWVFGLLEAGATGYVLKDEALETLVEAVRAVARGENWFSPAIRRQVVSRALGRNVGPETDAGEASMAGSLTPREIEVLQWLAQGLDNAAIARRLVITKRTVQNHVSSIYGKLGVSTRTEAALWAIRHGLITVESDDSRMDGG